MTGSYAAHYPHYAARNVEIAAKRKAGRTLRSLAAEYGLSAESIRRIEIATERRERESNPSGQGRIDDDGHETVFCAAYVGRQD